ncbi:MULTISPECIES: DotH/IcmK family type IV secretion protein [Cysteiniphilum]|uniref:Uncharacterized protein n=1 Tax=Cysteiniphilum litorale TaxID=2056700 RepID=A0A8J2Z328_9GAMM|nr:MULTISPECIES: DotH/IcmK family type IV secretion protein [Cysteiniphilum]GGF92591.1 hypothetical protein GCM10010995_07180 [Cysteiniphilum litorale]
MIFSKLKSLLVVLVVLVAMTSGVARGTEVEQTNKELSPQARYQAILNDQDQQKYKDLIALYQSGKTLKPSQIKALKEYNRSIEAAKNMIVKLKKNRRTFLYHDDQPPTIYIAKNRLTNIQFVDNAGNPYPIQDYNISDENAFKVFQRGGGNAATIVQSSDRKDYAYTPDKTQKKSDQQSDKKTDLLPASMRNSLTIDGTTDYAQGDLIIYLADKQMPVHLFLDSSDEQYDYQVNISIDGLTQSSLQEVKYTGVDFTRPSNAMMQFLNGTAPKGARPMDISISNASVWQYSGYFYVRTKAELQSPAYISRASTSSGYTVFQIASGNHVLSFVDHGRLIPASITEPMSIDGENDGEAQ